MFLLHSSWICGPAALSIDCDTAPCDSIRSLPVVLTSASTYAHIVLSLHSPTPLSVFIHCSCCTSGRIHVTGLWVHMSVEQVIHVTGLRVHMSVEQVIHVTGLQVHMSVEQVIHVTGLRVHMSVEQVSTGHTPFLPPSHRTEWNDACHDILSLLTQ